MLNPYDHEAADGVAGGRLRGDPDGGSVAVFGLGPIGQMCTRIAQQRGAERVFGIDLVPERLELTRRHGVETIESNGNGHVADVLRERTGGREPDAVIDAVHAMAVPHPSGEQLELTRGDRRMGGHGRLKGGSANPSS